MTRAPYSRNRLLSRSFLCIISALIVGPLSACETTEKLPQPAPRIPTNEVTMPLPAKCQASVKRPAAVDPTPELLAAPDDRFVQMLTAGRLMRDPYIGQLEAAVIGCGGRIE